MAHPINDLINRIEGHKAIACSNECKYFKFPHLKCACVLSEVFSVNQGEPCFEFKDKNLNIVQHAQEAIRTAR
jgi:hypothetical protein